MLVSVCGDRFAMQVDVVGDGFDSFCFAAMLHGKASLTQGGNETTGVGGAGYVLRLRAGSGLSTSDLNARMNLWVEASAVEHALEGMLGGTIAETTRIHARY